MPITDLEIEQGLSLEPREVVAIASHLLTKLAVIERSNPRLTDGTRLDYIFAKSKVTREQREPSDGGGDLADAYQKIIEILNGLLPKTFGEFISAARQAIQKENESDACHDLAKAIVLGEIHEGFNKVVFNLRAKVQAEIIKVLCYDTKEKGFVGELVEAYGFENLLPLLELSDQELVERGAQDSGDDNSAVEMVENGRQADKSIFSGRMMDKHGKENRFDLEDPQSVLEAIVTVIRKARQELSRSGAQQRLISAQRILIDNAPAEKPASKSKLRLV